MDRQGGELATRSAAKAHRQSVKRRIRNRAIKSATKTAVKNAGTAIAAGNVESARLAVRGAIVALDRAAAKGVIHPNNAARRKSRLLLKYNAAIAALQVPGEEKPAPRRAPAAKAAAKPAAKKPATRKAKK
jgi:small subunit ribosomal protein S20